MKRKQIKMYWKANKGKLKTLGRKDGIFFNFEKKVRKKVGKKLEKC